MSTLERFAELTGRTTLASFCPVLAEDDGLFRMDDGYIGRVYLAPAVAGANAKTQAALATMLELDFPAATMLQWQNWNLPGESETIRRWIVDRHNAIGGNAEAAALDQKIADAFYGYQSHPPLRNKKIVAERFLVLTIKIPADAEIDKQPEELRRLDSLMSQFIEGMQSAGIYFEGTNAQQYMNLIHHMLNPSSSVGPEYTDKLYINRQIDKPGDRIIFERKSGLHVRSSSGGVTHRLHIGIISVAKWPRRMSLALMNHLIGDPVGIQNQITVPNIVSTTIKFYDRADGLAMVKRRATATAFSTAGALLRWMPALAAKAEGFQVILKSIEGDRKRTVGAATSVILLHRSRRILEKAKGGVLAHLGSMNIVAGAESFIAFPAFWTHVPLWASYSGSENLDRFQTMSTEHATQTLPIFGDWLGTTSPQSPGHTNGSLYVTRRSEPATYNVFSPAHSNANWVMVAQPGGGKSFAAQNMIENQRALGTRLWVIDVGRSYLKLAAALGGEFRVFSEDSKLCLNPFTHVRLIQEDLPVLTTIIATMCDPSGQMFSGERGALYKSTIAESIRSQWTNVSNNLTPDQLYKFLKAQDDEIAQTLAATLFNFTRLGAYGKWFNGTNNLKMDNEFTVLELEELKRQPHLQSVVLQLLMLQISQELYTSEDKRKMVVIDESLDLVKDPMMSEFFNEAFQKYRKYGGSIGLIAQDLIRLYESPVGNSVRANAYTFFMLEQKAATISRMQKENYFDLDEYSWNEMRSLHTVRGSYSEMMVVTDSGNGVFRLVLPREHQILYSSDETERKSIFDALKNGEDIKEIVHARLRAEEQSRAITASDAAARRLDEQSSGATAYEGNGKTGGPGTKSLLNARRSASSRTLIGGTEPARDDWANVDAQPLLVPPALSPKPKGKLRAWIVAALGVGLVSLGVAAIISNNAPPKAHLIPIDVDRIGPTPAANPSSEGKRTQ